MTPGTIITQGRHRVVYPKVKITKLRNFFTKSFNKRVVQSTTHVDSALTPEVCDLKPILKGRQGKGLRRVLNYMIDNLDILPMP